MTTTTRSYWKLDQGDKKFTDTETMRSYVHAEVMHKITERMSWLSSEGRWHDVMRFALLCEETMTKFDENFNREMLGNVYHFEIAFGTFPITFSALRYTS